MALSDNARQAIEDSKKSIRRFTVGITIMAHSAIKEEVAQGKLLVVPIQNLNMIREINIVYHHDFKHTQILEDIRRIYNLNS